MLVFPLIKAPIAGCIGSVPEDDLFSGQTANITLYQTEL